MKKQVAETIQLFKTKHDLPFEVAEWKPLPQFKAAGNFIRFRVGTCHGLWQSTETAYEILVIVNDNKHNGHLDDVFQWFENSCKRDNKKLIVLEVWNKKFKQHLIDKRGFSVYKDDDVIK